MKGLILAGGKGTRLRPLTINTPKPVVPVANSPFLLYQIDLMRSGGIGEIIYTKGVGGRKSIGARSIDGEAISRDAEVVIIGYEKGIAQVQTWDRFLNETDELEDESLRIKQGGNDSA